MRALQMPSVKDWSLNRKRRAINEALYKMGFNTWYDAIPVAEIIALLERFGFDGSCMEGIYCGADGMMHEAIAGAKLWITMTWYRMPSGRYEIVSYVS